MKDKIITAKDIAKYYNISLITVRRYIKSGKLKAYKVGNEYRFRSEDLPVMGPVETNSSWQKRKELIENLQRIKDEYKSVGDGIDVGMSQQIKLLLDYIEDNDIKESCIYYI